MPSNDIALRLIVSEKVYVSQLCSFVIVFPAASSTAVVAFALSINAGGHPRIRRSPLCWNASRRW